MINTSIEITNIKAKKSLEGKEHVIEWVSFTVKADDGKHSFSLGGVTKLTFDPDNFVEWEDTPEFKAKLIDWTKPYSDDLIIACANEVTELAKEEDETLSFTEM
jgi:hypothetical protein